ncbi:MAG: polyribonucleotide nucleotidyltransferase [Candidatus Colwellbacteria bacterium]|nr:polyribonucleotide nucleotidyltransferase [Candidatus Colwellbacteria bacterium]
MDLERKKFVKNIGGRDLILEVSRLAEQTNASVLGTYGGTMVLVTVVMGDEDSGLDYLPLTVDYEERFYAAGKILGSRFIRREGRPSDEAILSGRLIDRTLRPLFDERIRRAIQIVITVLSYDEENDPDFVALVTASTALSISDIPWNGPVAGVSIGEVNGKLELNPVLSLLHDKENKVGFESFFAGKEGVINMIELGGDEVSEANALKAAETASGVIKELIDFQNEIVAQIGKPKSELRLAEPSREFSAAVKKFLEGKLEETLYIEAKVDRIGRLGELKESLKEHLALEGFSADELKMLDQIFDNETDEVMSQNVLENERRPDGRKLDEIRELYSEVKLLPRAHGSALFVRGTTQALAAVTLGPPRAEQLIETIEYSGKKRFMLHYNFPPFSVGEARSSRGPGRREIGHGALAEKAIRPVIPIAENFPYTIRVVSDILSSNGSTSMATVSAASLSLMDAGVPIKAAVAGISIGLVMAPDGRYKLLTDIQGPEDHYGDMDFKVAGTRKGLNAIQMDVKVEGVTIEILRKALERAKIARHQILDFTDRVISEPRAELSPLAPKILTFLIDPSHIGEVIGPGGKVINAIIERTGAISIDIDDDGQVFITADKPGSAEQAAAEIKAIVKVFEVGEVVEGEVVKLLDFGAIVELGGGRSGLLHVSELKEGFTKNVEDVVKLGDRVKVKVIKTENGKISLSLRQAEGGATPSPQERSPLG